MQKLNYENFCVNLVELSPFEEKRKGLILSDEKSIAKIIRQSFFENVDEFVSTKSFYLPNVETGLVNKQLESYKANIEQISTFKIAFFFYPITK